MFIQNEEKDFCIVLCTVPKENYAIKISKILLMNNLAACISLYPKVRSLYYWNEKINDHFEVQLFIKSKKKLLKEIFFYILKNHPYQVPELLVLPIIDGNKNYLSWISSCLKI